MGIFLSDRELDTVMGEHHALVTMYALAIRPRMNYETGMVGEWPRISYRALQEWCYIEPNAHGGAKPLQLSIQQVRRILGRMERIGLITKTTVTDPSTRREYIQLFCAMASLKKPKISITAESQPRPTTRPATAPPTTCHLSRTLRASRATRVSRRSPCRPGVIAASKNELNPSADQCAQIATDRGSDRLNPSNDAAFRQSPDRGGDIHQRRIKGLPPLPPTPFAANTGSQVSRGVFDYQGSNPPTSNAHIATKESEMDIAKPSPAPLIWPICIHDTQKLSLLRHLASSIQPQALLDELAGAHQAGQIRTSPVGYLMGLLRRESEGSFIPERGIAIMETRRAHADHLARRQASLPQQNAGEATTPVPENSALGKLLAKLPIPRQHGTEPNR